MCSWPFRPSRTTSQLGRLSVCDARRPNAPSSHSAVCRLWTQAKGCFSYTISPIRLFLYCQFGVGDRDVISDQNLTGFLCQSCSVSWLAYVMSINENSMLKYKHCSHKSNLHYHTATFYNFFMWITQICQTGQWTKNKYVSVILNSTLFLCKMCASVLLKFFVQSGTN